MTRLCLDFKQKRALTNELEHVEIPFSKTPFDKNRLHEEYEDGHLIIQCTVKLDF